MIAWIRGYLERRERIHANNTKSLLADTLDVAAKKYAQSPEPLKLDNALLYVAACVRYNLPFVYDDFVTICKVKPDKKSRTRRMVMVKGGKKKDAK